MKRSLTALKDTAITAPQPLFAPDGFNIERTRLLTSASDFSLPGECVVYWMIRDQRVYDNHALLYAQKLAISRLVPLHVVFALAPSFLGASMRQYDFMLTGLQEVEQQLRTLEMPFHLLLGDPGAVLPVFVSERAACAVVCDFSPLRPPRRWVSVVAKALDTGEHQSSDGTNVNGSSNSSSSGGRISIRGRVPLYEVDARNVVPCWRASPKQEYSARTLRGKLTALLPHFLREMEAPVSSPYPDALVGVPLTDWTAARASLRADTSVEPATWLVPGYAAGMRVLDQFLQVRLPRYADSRNDPNAGAQSGLSPYFHFGQISVQRAVLRAKDPALRRHAAAVDAFVEEAVVRRELSENFCFYCSAYDSLAGAPAWAQESLRLHEADQRPVLYDSVALETGRTRDALWNAAQLQMTRTGKMHGFLRMYWAKKILEWTPSAAEALRIAIYLNDKYELDGRDPNGYVGCLWSVAGLHDQGWGERPIFGKIRYMNYQGCMRKFDVARFVAAHAPAAAHARAAEALPSPNVTAAVVGGRPNSTVATAPTVEPSSTRENTPGKKRRKDADN